MYRFGSGVMNAPPMIMILADDNDDDDDNNEDDDDDGTPPLFYSYMGPHSLRLLGVH
jgi:hypothetical protein